MPQQPCCSKASRSIAFCPECDGVVGSVAVLQFFERAAPYVLRSLATEGAWVGPAEGEVLGALLGDALGDAVGASVEGERVGTPLGDPVVGVEVGASVGVTVGDAEGDSVSP